MSEQNKQDPIATAVDRFECAIAGFEEKQCKTLDAVVERIEILEVLGNAPRKSIENAVPETHRTLYSKSGQPAYVVGKGQNLAAIPELQSKSEISLDRWCNALIFGADCGDQDALEYLAEQKATTTSSTGVLIPAGHVAQWIDMMRAQSVLFAAGAQTVTMPEKTLTYAHQTADPTAVWRGTEGASLSAADPAFAARVLTAKTLAIRTQVSLEASQDIPDFGAQIAKAYTAALAAAIDSSGFIGTGAAPTGLHTLSGVGAVTSVGLPTNYDEILDGVQVFLNANNSIDDLSGIVSHPDVWRVYAGLKTGLSGDETSLQLPPSIAAVPQFVSTGSDIVASPENYHVTLGNFRDLVVGIRMDPTIRVLDATTSMASNLLVEIVGVARIDIAALRPASFVVLSGIATS